MRTKVFFIVLLSVISQLISSQNLVKVAGLQGEWKFNIGDDKSWSQVNFNDNDWALIRVPSPWEDQGYNGYDGFAWYRKAVTIPGKYENGGFYLYLGYIDDADEVYFNGNLIGSSGSFYPRYTTAYNAFRKYYVPKKYIKFDSPNVIAVRVFDAGLAGGIVDGETAVYADINPFPLQIDFQGLWNFKTGDNMDYKEPDFNDGNWHAILVPKVWEDQGYPDYDGYAWYRKKFIVNADLAKQKIVLVLGKIDDLDEVYINGQYIGPVRKIADYGSQTRYDQFRVYYLPDNLFQPDKVNTIAVRVLDQGGFGGIYEGPVGIVKLTDYVNYWKNKANK